MTRSLTRKDFLVFTAASAGTALIAASCSSDNTSSSGGAGAGPAPGGSPGAGGTSPASGGASAGTPSSGGSSAGTPGGGAGGAATGGSAAGGAAGTAGSGAGGVSGAGGKGAIGGMSGVGGGAAGSCTADVVAKISCPHDPPHMLTISKSDIDAAVADKVFTLSMAAGHTHTITMSAADWSMLKSGGTVFKFVEAGAYQDHCVVLSCGTVNAATAAGSMCGGTAPVASGTGGSGGSGGGGVSNNDVTCATPWP